MWDPQSPHQPHQSGAVDMAGLGRGRSFGGLPDNGCGSSVLCLERPVGTRLWGPGCPAQGGAVPNPSHLLAMQAAPGPAGKLGAVRHSLPTPPRQPVGPHPCPLTPHTPGTLPAPIPPGPFSPPGPSPDLG